MTSQVELISMGGTIAMMPTAGGGIAPTLSGEDLLRATDRTAGVASVSARTHRTVPGAHLTLEDVVELTGAVREALASGADGVVVTQGTDTIEETAYALDLLLDVDQPVVITGAMRGPGAAGADGPANLDAAIRVAASPSARCRGVVVVLNEQVHAARWVAKAHTSRPDAFRSPVAGPLGEVIEGDVRWSWTGGPRLHIEPPPGATIPAVPLVATWLGDDASVLNAVLQLAPAAVIVEAMGAGHVPPALIQPLGRAAERIPVVLTSRVGAGPVFRSTYGFPGSERDLLARHLLWGGSLPGRKARIVTALALAAGWPRERLQGAFSSADGVSG